MPLRPMAPAGQVGLHQCTLCSSTSQRHGLGGSLSSELSARCACDTSAPPRYPSAPRLLHLSRQAHSAEAPLRPALAAAHRCCCCRSRPPAVSLQQVERHAIAPAEALLTSVLAAAAGGTRMQRIKLLVHASALPPRCVRCLQVLLRQLGRQLCNWGGRSRQPVSRIPCSGLHATSMQPACGAGSARTAPHTHPPAGPLSLPPLHSPR